MNMSTSGSQFDIQQRIDAYRYTGSTSQTAAKSLTKSSDPIEGESAFENVLKTKIGAIKFSAHASSRLKSRNITMTPEIMGKLEKAVSGAANKGARDSLILMKNCAFIVNIPNRTVITAMDGDSMNNNIFTNIDSAVLAD